MLKLFRFYTDVGRAGHLEGLFIATQELVDAAVGKYAYFGEVLGKHSEVAGNLEEDDITLISDDQEKINWLLALCGETVSGYNPLDYIEEH